MGFFNDVPIEDCEKINSIYDANNKVLVKLFRLKLGLLNVMFSEIIREIDKKAIN